MHYIEFAFNASRKVLLGPDPSPLNAEEEWAVEASRSTFGPAFAARLPFGGKVAPAPDWAPNGGGGRCGDGESRDGLPSRGELIVLHSIETDGAAAAAAAVGGAGHHHAQHRQQGGPGQDAQEGSYVRNPQQPHLPGGLVEAAEGAWPLAGRSRRDEVIR